MTTQPDPVLENGHAEIDYTNWRGERRKRSISPMHLVFGIKPPWHEKPGWLLFARDLDLEKQTNKLEFRWFALRGIHSWRDV